LKLSIAARQFQECRNHPINELITPFQRQLPTTFLVYKSIPDIKISTPYRMHQGDGGMPIPSRPSF
ncbi:hypothetical protein, partial [Pseudomonas sp.]|uniref:hypothetical protein n=1 Tax=Pseudomonas sp. TaxID=306 RepID=UPI003F9C775F